MKPRTQEEMDALYSDHYGEACAAHVEAYHLHNALALSAYCDYHRGKRVSAYATSTGSQAHREAQEAGRMQQDFDNAKPYSTERRYL